MNIESAKMYDSNNQVRAIELTMSVSEYFGETVIPGLEFNSDKVALRGDSHMRKRVNGRYVQFSDTMLRCNESSEPYIIMHLPVCATVQNDLENLAIIASTVLGNKSKFTWNRQFKRIRENTDISIVFKMLDLMLAGDSVKFTHFDGNKTTKDNGGDADIEEFLTHISIEMNV